MPTLVPSTASQTAKPSSTGPLCCSPSRASTSGAAPAVTPPRFAECRCHLRCAPPREAHLGAASVIAPASPPSLDARSRRRAPAGPPRTPLSRSPPRCSPMLGPAGSLPRNHPPRPLLVRRPTHRSRPRARCRSPIATSSRAAASRFVQTASRDCSLRPSSLRSSLPVLESRRTLLLAGWPREVALPGLPQIRTCGTPASGSSGRGFATRRTGARCGAAGAETAPAARAGGPSRRTRCWSGVIATCARHAVSLGRSARALGSST